MFPLHHSRRHLTSPSKLQPLLHTSRNAYFNAPSVAALQVRSSSSRPSRLPEPLEWSYLSVKGEKGLLGMTVGQTLDRAEVLFGDREAVVSVHQNVRKTFQQLNADVSAIETVLLLSVNISFPALINYMSFNFASFLLFGILCMTIKWLCDCIYNFRNFV